MTIIWAVSWHSELKLCENWTELRDRNFHTSTFAWNIVLIAQCRSKKIHGHLTWRSLMCILWQPFSSTSKSALCLSIRSNFSQQSDTTTLTKSVHYY